jgi:hypothetical protein
LAFPEFATIARIPLATNGRVYLTGAAFTLFFVKTAAASQGESDTMTPTPYLPLFIPAALNPGLHTPYLVWRISMVYY